MAFFAHDQKAGKGQRGKSWQSLKGANIALSIVIKPQPLLLTQQFQLSACVAVAIQEFFMKYAGDATKIKWPNDLYWQDRKAGGILIENLVGIGELEIGNWQWSIIGIGININQTSFGADLPNPVSLKQITGKNFDALELARELCTKLEFYYRKLLKNGFEKIYEEYLSCLYKRNETVKLKKDNRVFEALIKSVTPTGQLIIQHAIEESIEFGNVEWV